MFGCEACVIGCVTHCAAALRTANEILLRRSDLDLDTDKLPKDQLEQCLRLLLSEAADVTNL